MKKILSLACLLGAAVAFTACTGEEDDLFDKSAAERLNEVSNVYTQRLIDAKGGWTMEYYPTNGNSAPTGLGYLLLAKFNQDRSVTMAMNNAMSNNAYLTENSTWDIITDNGPVLSFNSYNNCLHVFSDPGIYEQGLGYEGDYEFVVISLEEGAQEAMIKGKKRGTYIHLSKLEEGTDFEEYLADVNAFKDKMFSSAAPTENLIVADTIKYSVLNASSGLMPIYPYGGDVISETTPYPYLITKHGGQYYLRFRDLVQLADNVGVQDFVYQPEEDNFIEVNSGGCTIEGSDPAPFFAETLETGSYSWQLTADTEMADFYANLLTGISDDIGSTLTGSLKNIYLRNTDTGVKLVVSYGTSRRSYLLNYALQYSISDGAFAVQSATAESDNASKLLNSSASLKSFIESLGQSHGITANLSKFNLSQIRLTNQSDSSKWLVWNIL